MHLFAWPYNEYVSLQAEFSRCAVFQDNLSIALVILVDTITTQCRVTTEHLINAPRHLYYIPYC